MLGRGPARPPALVRVGRRPPVARVGLRRAPGVRRPGHDLPNEVLDRPPSSVVARVGPAERARTRQAHLPSRPRPRQRTSRRTEPRGACPLDRGGVAAHRSTAGRARPGAGVDLAGCGPRRSSERVRIPATHVAPLRPALPGVGGLRRRHGHVVVDAALPRFAVHVPLPPLPRRHRREQAPGRAAPYRAGSPGRRRLHRPRGHRQRLRVLPFRNGARIRRPPLHRRHRGAGGPPAGRGPEPARARHAQGVARRRSRPVRPLHGRTLPVRSPSAFRPAVSGGRLGCGSRRKRPQREGGGRLRRGDRLHRLADRPVAERSSMAAASSAMP